MGVRFFAYSHYTPNSGPYQAGSLGVGVVLGARAAALAPKTTEIPKDPSSAHGFLYAAGRLRLISREQERLRMDENTAYWYRSYQNFLDIPRFVDITKKNFDIRKDLIGYAIIQR